MFINIKEIRKCERIDIEEIFLRRIYSRMEGFGLLVFYFFVEENLVIIWIGYVRKLGAGIFGVCEFGSFFISGFCRILEIFFLEDVGIRIYIV